MWPPNSPDLNPMDYAVWGALQEMVYHRKTFTSVQELKRAIITAWQQLSQAFLDRSIGEWRRRLENVYVALNVYSVMVDTSSMFVELKSTTLVLWT